MLGFVAEGSLILGLWQGELSVEGDRSGAVLQGGLGKLVGVGGALGSQAARYGFFAVLTDSPAAGLAVG